MRKLWHDEAWEEYLYWQSQDKKTLKKINRLLTDIDRNGYQCTGKPEPLGENLAGYWSVRIDEKNRIVFQVILQRPFARTRVGVSRNQNSEKKQQPFVDLIVFVVVCIVLYLMHKPKVFTDFLMIDVMELLFLIELICTIFIDLKGKK